jgi:hypothetical protein
LYANNFAGSSDNRFYDNSAAKTGEKFCMRGQAVEYFAAQTILEHNSSGGVMKRTFPMLVAIFSFGLITTQARQAPPSPKQNTAAAAVMNITAKSANVGEPGIPVRIDILRWSTDEEMLPMLAALNPALAPPPAAGARGGRGGGRGGRGAQAAADDVAPDPALAEVDGAGGGGGGGRGGRGGGRGGRGGRGGDAAAAPAKPPDPIQILNTAIEKAPTVGYIWTNEVVGYSIKYAQRIASPDGSERIILATDRRLGGVTNAWKPAGSVTPTDYEFTVIELRLSSKGVSEGKTTLTAKVAIDNDTKALGLENYAGTPVMLASVKK